MTSSNRAIHKVLIANRGEIACRVIRTLRTMGIRSVAVYSEADRSAPHVQQADEAWFIGPAPASESYLKMDTLLAVAKESGADAIHPGYGFLSENPQFAAACETAGIKFIGPSSRSISAMGSKSAAKLIMEKAAVPLIPGYHGDNQGDAFLHQQADRIGYPLLIKAAFGGGGKGMRVVEASEHFLEALQSCRREGQASFGNPTVLLEKYLTQPRHVEIQVFCDQHGNGVYLHERDCSIQRRHQKIIEEAPAPGLSSETRKAMGEAAVAAARAIDYEGAGTIEFLYDVDGRFYFMEMNTRLQVEHPVTEYITRQDLVEWQIRVARGETLPLAQAEIPLYGHAIEARICAESPDLEFRPSIGLLTHFRTPNTHPDVRVDTGIEGGSEISMYYDPMVAKLIVHGATREQAIDRLLVALEQFQVLGVETNINYLHRILSLPAFRNADLSTHFLQKEQSGIHDRLIQITPAYFAWAAAALLQSEQTRSHATQQQAAQSSPWQNADGWQLNGAQQRRYTLKCGEQIETVTLTYRAEHYTASVGDEAAFSFDARTQGGLLRVGGQKTITLPFHLDAKGITFFLSGKPLSFSRYQADYSNTEHADAGQLQASMPGRIVSVLVSNGDQVEAGQTLLIMEAMKMEHTLRAPFDGIVTAVHYKVGDAVPEGAELVALEELAEPNS
ncbi:Putative acyl-CoA carboxylase alpha chain protein [gamma proteobacterium HdN1]|nr:Putative acyl-CoA carboxylase alpha chain protein [gamma proteobacterium HdN1]